MAEPKLKFYTGEVTTGQKDGVATNTAVFKFPNSVNPTYLHYAYKAPIKFALRCDEGYRADNVSLTFKSNADNLLVKFMNSGYDYLDKIGSVTETNTIFYVVSGGVANNLSLNVYASYTEVKL